MPRYPSQRLRLWAGPEVRVEYLEGHTTDGGYRNFEDSFAIGLGPVLGVNVPVSKDLSLTLRGGYIFQTGLKMFTDWNERFGFLSLGVLIRMGEG